MSLSLNDYQAQASAFRLESADDVYCRENLVGEVGEYFSLRAKSRRDGKSPEYSIHARKELGDILWQLSQVCADEGFTLEEIAMSNINKLQDRLARKVISGSGDER